MRQKAPVPAIVAVIAVAAVAAVLIFGDNDTDEAACPSVEPTSASPYVVDVHEPLTQQGAVRMTVTRDGQPVTGASLCLSSVMVGMEDMGASDEANEVAPGIYEAEPGFEMAGQWTGTVVITEADGPDAALPLSFDVE